MKKERKIKLFNGRFNLREHIYIGAYNIKDAAIILQQAYGTHMEMVYEINMYFSKNAWGNIMERIKPERGAWVTKRYNEKPIRIV